MPVPHIRGPGNLADKRITDRPAMADFVRFKPGFGQRYVVTVDTEEEFDWTRPIERTRHTVQTAARLARFQEFCEGQGVCPIYLIDYPIVSSPAAVEILRDAVQAGKAEVGVQLHPWVNPPFTEELTPHNSYVGNLPPDLEEEKFAALRDLPRTQTRDALAAEAHLAAGQRQHAGDQVEGGGLASTVRSEES